MIGNNFKCGSKPRAQQQIADHFPMVTLQQLRVKAGVRSCALTAPIEITATGKNLINTAII
jgi:hypothetical protein